jgi:hypothetical protein
MKKTRMTILRKIGNNLKNLPGWKTNRKIVVFSVDDYGNVRLDSPQARKKLDIAGLKVTSRYDVYDALETREDLEMLYETLGSVKDQHGAPAVFTPFAVPCNINFEKMAVTGNECYQYELLPETYSKLKGYEGTWKLWQEGIQNGLLMPQFHGREHLNLKVFEYLLREKNKDLHVCLVNRSYTSIAAKPFEAINYTAAFDFQELEENESLRLIIADGLKCFEKVFGYRACHFMAPKAKIHPSNFDVLKENGIQYIDTGMIQKQHQGNNRYKTSFNYSGKETKNGQTLVVRNCVFEPTATGIDQAVQNCLSQINAAFNFGKPAIVSSHRVNFCGHIDLRNRKTGILALKQLLKAIVKCWPEVEFMSSARLFSHMEKKL